MGQRTIDTNTYWLKVKDGGIAPLGAVSLEEDGVLQPEYWLEVAHDEVLQRKDYPELFDYLKNVQNFDLEDDDAEFVVPNLRGLVVND